MQSVTNCPACQTQFVVTEEQLNQHNGKVRCGHCLNVFNASEHLVNTDSDTSLEKNDAAIVVIAPLEASSINTGLVELSAPTETSTELTPTDNTAIFDITEPANEALIADVQPSNFDDLADKSKLNPKHTAQKTKHWLWLLLALMLFAAIAQSLYFLRHQIAIYYPNIKPLFVQACTKIGCSIDLPKKIEFIIIDDSDIQEDPNHADLMRLSSTLINQAGFNQAYPNLELTLTDVEDKPKLRRIFKPIEYLPSNTNIAAGLGPGEEVKVNLAMTTQGNIVSGYRVFVTY